MANFASAWSARATGFLAGLIGGYALVELPGRAEDVLGSLMSDIISVVGTVSVVIFASALIVSGAAAIVSALKS